VRAAGLVLALGGLALAGRSAQLLAGRGRPRRGARPAFVVAGPYVRIRNPLFAGAVIALAGAALAAASWSLAALAAAGLVVAHGWFVRGENPARSARVGTPHPEYLRRVPRWLPRGHRKRAGAEHWTGAS
jgi:protein-S-isoprenylcysteine O-methyltransferase Ste14